jgi:hypothetical protein
MKNNDNDRLLSHKRRVDAERRAQAILRTRHQQQVNAERMERVALAGAKRTLRDAGLI